MHNEKRIDKCIDNAVISPSESSRRTRRRLSLRCRCVFSLSLSSRVLRCSLRFRRVFRCLFRFFFVFCFAAFLTAILAAFSLLACIASCCVVGCCFRRVFASFLSRLFLFCALVDKYSLRVYALLRVRLVFLLAAFRLRFRFVFLVAALSLNVVAAFWLRFSVVE